MPEQERQTVPQPLEAGLQHYLSQFICARVSTRAHACFGAPSSSIVHCSGTVPQGFPRPLKGPHAHYVNGHIPAGDAWVLSSQRMRNSWRRLSTACPASPLHPAPPAVFPGQEFQQALRHTVNKSGSLYDLVKSPSTSKSFCGS